MKRWYVVQVYAGYEKIAVADIKKSIEEQGLQDYFGDILIPSAKMGQFFTDQDTLKDTQLFPGYILVNMEPVPAALKLVSSAAKVTRFLGGKEPTPLTQKEIERVLAQMKGELLIAPDKAEFEIGKEVEIATGPFAGFVGIVDKIDKESDRLVVMVSIFGRMTPVELGFDQVKR
jgi:transcriptional antiterminator NusG